MVGRGEGRVTDRNAVLIVGKRKVPNLSMFPTMHLKKYSCNRISPVGVTPRAFFIVRGASRAGRARLQMGLCTIAINLLCWVSDLDVLAVIRL